MTAKILFTGDLAAATDTVFGPVPAGKAWEFAINVCNRTSAVIPFRLAIGAASTPAVSEYFNYDVPVGSVPLQRTQLVAPSGYYVIVRAGAAGLSINGYGYEE